METITITTQAKAISSIREMVDPMTGKRRIGLLYYHRLPDGGIVSHTLSEATSKEFLVENIREQRIYLPVHPITAEKS